MAISPEAKERGDKYKAATPEQRKEMGEKKKAEFEKKDAELKASDPKKWQEMQDRKKAAMEKRKHAPKGAKSSSPAKPPFTISPEMGEKKKAEFEKKDAELKASA